MFSKFVIISILSALLLGCGLKMGEKKVTNEIVEIQSAKCLDQAVGQLKLFVAGNATDAEASNAFQCLQEVFITFKDNIRGDTKDVYTPQEIAQFIEKNFIKDSTHFSPAFLAELMKFKIVLIGGDINVIHKNEIKQLVDILAQLTPDLVRLNKSMKILTFKWDKNLQPTDLTEKEAQFQAAHDDLEAVIQKLTGEFIRQARPYYVDDIVSFGKEIATFANAKPETVTKIENAREVVKKVKVALIGGPLSLQNQEWSTLGMVLNDGLFQLLRYEYFVKDLSDDQKYESWTQYEKISTDTIQLIENLLVAKDTQMISSDEITQLIQALQGQDFLTKNIRLESIKSLLNGLFANLLNSPEQRLQGQILPGFNIQAVQLISKQVLQFIKVQKVVTQVFEVTPNLSQSDVQLVLQTAADAAVTEPELQKGLLELKQVLSSKVALTFNDKKFLKILSSDAGIYHYTDVLFSNFARAGVHWFIQSYATDANRVETIAGLTQAEAEAAFNQFKGIVLDLDVIDSKTADAFIASRFREASLFLTSSDGDLLISLNETHDLVLHILSGLFRADSGKDAIAKRCLPGFTGEIKSSTVIPEDCLIQFYLTEIDMFADLPLFLSLKDEFTEDQRKEYFMNLLKAAGHVPNAEKVVYFGDANLFPHVLQYVEMIYASYDANHDNRIDKDEALVAYPVFRDTIRTVAVTLIPSFKEEMLPGTFMYLLKYGKPPKTLAEKLAFASFATNPEKWILNTTRLDLGKIFNTIAEATAAPAPPKP